MEEFGDYPWDEMENEAGPGWLLTEKEVFHKEHGATVHSIFYDKNGILPSAWPVIPDILCAARGLSPETLLLYEAAPERAVVPFPQSVGIGNDIIWVELADGGHVTLTGAPPIPRRR